MKVTAIDSAHGTITIEDGLRFLTYPDGMRFRWMPDRTVLDDGSVILQGSHWIGTYDGARSTYRFVPGFDKASARAAHLERKRRRKRSGR